MSSPTCIHSSFCQMLTLFKRISPVMKREKVTWNEEAMLSINDVYYGQVIWVEPTVVYIPNQGKGYYGCIMTEHAMILCQVLKQSYTNFMLRGSPFIHGDHKILFIRIEDIFKIKIHDFTDPIFGKDEFNKGSWRLTIKFEKNKSQNYISRKIDMIIPYQNSYFGGALMHLILDVASKKLVGLNANYTSLFESDPYGETKIHFAEKYFEKRKKQLLYDCKTIHEQVEVLEEIAHQAMTDKGLKKVFFIRKNLFTLLLRWIFNFPKDIEFVVSNIKHSIRTGKPDEEYFNHESYNDELYSADSESKLKNFSKRRRSSIIRRLSKQSSSFDQENYPVNNHEDNIDKKVQGFKRHPRLSKINIKEQEDRENQNSTPFDFIEEKITQRLLTPVKEGPGSHFLAYPDERTHVVDGPKVENDEAKIDQLPSNPTSEDENDWKHPWAYIARLLASLRVIYAVMFSSDIAPERFSLLVDRETMPMSVLVRLFSYDYTWVVPTVIKAYEEVSNFERKKLENENYKKDDEDNEDPTTYSSNFSARLSTNNINNVLQLKETLREHRKQGLKISLVDEFRIINMTQPNPADPFGFTSSSSIAATFVKSLLKKTKNGEKSLNMSKEENRARDMILTVMDTQVSILSRLDIMIYKFGIVVNNQKKVIQLAQLMMKHTPDLSAFLRQIILRLINLLSPKDEGAQLKNSFKTKRQTSNNSTSLSPSSPLAFQPNESLELAMGSKTYYHQKKKHFPSTPEVKHKKKKRLPVDDKQEINGDGEEEKEKDSEHSLAKPKLKRKHRQKKKGKKNQKKETEPIKSKPSISGILQPFPLFRKPNLFKNILSGSREKEENPSFSTENEENSINNELSPFNTPRNEENNSPDTKSVVRPALSPLNQHSKWNIVRSVHAALGPEGWKRRESLLLRTRNIVYLTRPPLVVYNYAVLLRSILTCSYEMRDVLADACSEELLLYFLPLVKKAQDEHYNNDNDLDSNTYEEVITLRALEELKLIVELLKARQKYH